MSVANFESTSRQFDTTREEIVATFRERIQNSKRRKLTKQEFEELIDIFIARLQLIDDAELIKRLCEREIALLEEGYPAASVAKNYLPKYRKAIAQAIESQRISLNEDNSHQYTYFKDGAEHLTTEHWALTYLKYNRADYEEFAKSTIRNNNLKQDSLKAVNPDLYLEAVDSLLESSQPLELAIAIAAASGRRFSEVMARGDFSATDHPYQIHFSGQLKKRGSTDNDEYPIYTLVPASKVLDALKRFRTHPDIAELENAEISEINQLNTPINRLVKHYFQDTNLVPVLSEEASVTIQNLRGIYGEIAVHFFCPEEMGIHRFIQQKLGHLISNPSLAIRKNSGSTEHYFHYYLVDSQGKQLADKGVLLSQLSSPPFETAEKPNSVEDEVNQIEQLELPTQNENAESLCFTESTSGDDVLQDSSSDKVSSSKVSLRSSSVDSASTVVAPSEAGSEVPAQSAVSSLPDLHSNHASELSTTLTPEGVSHIRNELEAIRPLQNQSYTREKVASSTTELSSNSDSRAFLACIRTLITSDDYRHLLVGLMASCGLDATSLLKLLVFKQAIAPHLILYCQQLHPSHQPLQQLLTLGDANEVIDAIARLRRHRDAIDFAHRLTGEEINEAVQQFSPDVLKSVGLSPNLDLARQYQDFIPLLLKEDISVRVSRAYISTDTQSHLEQWQQHFHADLDATLNELMRLAGKALSSPSQDDVRSPTNSTSVSPNSQTYSTPSLSPNPWLAISRLTDTVAHLTERVLSQNERLIELQLSATSHSAVNSSTEPPTKRKTHRRSSAESSASSSSQTSSSHADFDALKNMSSEDLRTSRATGSPTEKLNRALDALITYNQQQSEPKHMWRINTAILQQLTGCFNSYVKDFVRQHQKLIDQHNQQFGLTSVRHNAVHQGLDPNSFIKW